MINASSVVLHRLPQGTPIWQRELQHAIHDPQHLAQLLELPETWLQTELLTAPHFKLRVPRGYVTRMEKGNIDDPLLRQVLPLQIEQQTIAGFSHDPVGDNAAVVTQGLLHKYQGRVLLVTTGACAIHCRYCFRQHFDYGTTQALRDPQVWAYLIQNTDIEEVILSGGDPLLLTDDKLAKFAQQLAQLPHIKRLRFHTRIPLVLPERIDSHFLSWINQLRNTAPHLQLIMVIHANHANEIAGDVLHALSDLRNAGMVLLNQSVLLRSINDDVITLKQLSEKLFENHVLPYYIHLLDKVQGAAHFDVGLEQATALMLALREQLAGYLVPRLVQEQAGLPYKFPLI